MQCRQLSLIQVFSLMPQCKCQIIADRLQDHNRNATGQLMPTPMHVACDNYDPHSVHHHGTVRVLLFTCLITGLLLR